MPSSAASRARTLRSLGYARTAPPAWLRPRRPRRVAHAACSAPPPARAAPGPRRPPAPPARAA
ncbi:2-oxo acid dehydrogenase subunit E2, partial [Actinoplanes sp. NPDC051633]